MVITILRISAMIFSLYGYALFFREKIGFREKVSWVAGVSFITLVLYFAAYLNWLKGTGIGLFIVGCFLALMFIYRKVKEQRLQLDRISDKSHNTYITNDKEFVEKISCFWKSTHSRDEVKNLDFSKTVTYWVYRGRFYEVLND